MPDGGIHEDFPHITGIVQVSTANGTMRPFLVVGIVINRACIAQRRMVERYFYAGH